MHVLPAHLEAELADRLEERQALDVAHRAADLGDDDVHVRRVASAPDARLDLVGDVRDHLDGLAEVVALAARCSMTALVDLAGGEVAELARQVACR